MDRIYAPAARINSRAARELIDKGKAVVARMVGVDPSTLRRALNKGCAV